MLVVVTRQIDEAPLTPGVERERADGSSPGKFTVFGWSLLRCFRLLLPLLPAASAAAAVRLLAAGR